MNRYVVLAAAAAENAEEEEKSGGKAAGYLADILQWLWDAFLWVITTIGNFFQIIYDAIAKPYKDPFGVGDPGITILISLFFIGLIIAACIILTMRLGKWVLFFVVFFGIAGFINFIIGA